MNQSLIFFPVLSLSVSGLGIWPHLRNVFCMTLQLHPDDGLFHYILQVGKASPDVAHVLKRVSTGTRIPVPVPREQDLPIRNPDQHIPMRNCS
uniref:Uncharacterized protein n=1 Tax=Melopsittacus undulatus TaxID=13146 RepID=A0A8V5H1U3_MELUD